MNVPDVSIMGITNYICKYYQSFLKNTFTKMIMRKFLEILLTTKKNKFFDKTC